MIVNEPYRSTRTVSNLPAGYQDLDGVPRTSVTLAGGQGVVLVPIPTPVRHADARAAGRSTPDPAAVAPVSTATPAPVTPAPPTKITTVSTGGNGAAKARASGTAGAADPGGTSVSVQGSARRLSGRVRGAVAGYVRLTVERKRAGQVGRRAAHEGLGQEERQLLAGHPAPEPRPLPRQRLLRGHRHVEAVALVG